MLNLNRASLSLESVNVAINDAIERAAATTAELPRPYLGASIIGDDCARKVQYSWWIRPELPARVRAIFDRGHYFELRSRQQLIAAGFKFAPPEALAFSAVNGALRGHADGIIIHGPDLPGAYLIFPLIWEHKAVNAKNWRAVERDGLEKTFPQYAAQVALYQAYLRHHQSRTVHGDKRRHVRVAPLPRAIQRRARAVLVRPCRQHHRSDARRGAASARL